MNSCNTDIFFSNYYHLLSVRFEQIPISQTTDSHFANYRFSFRKLQISISQTTDFHFANYRYPFRFVPFRFANYSKPLRRYFVTNFSGEKMKGQLDRNHAIFQMRSIVDRVNKDQQSTESMQCNFITRTGKSHCHLFVAIISKARVQFLS